MEKKFYKSKDKPKKEKKVKVVGCGACELQNKCQTPKIPVFGEGQDSILVINESPTKLEDRTGKPYQGETGQILKKMFPNNDFKKDFWYVNAVRCQSSKIAAKDISNCRVNLIQTINELKPQKIITLGKLSLQTLIGHKMSVTGMEKFAGYKIPDQEYKCWVYPLYSPRDIIENEKNVMLEKFNIRYAKQAIEHEELWQNNIIPDKDISIIKDCMGATIYMEGLNNLPIDILTFDYETTGIKPYKEGHRIKSVSFAFDTDTVATSFLIYDDKDFKRALRKVLQNPRTKKVAQNLQFEDTWTKQILKYPVKNWHWDTCVATHVLDNRTGITGLKFQVYVRYGVAEYNKIVDPFLDSKSKNSNDFNTIDDAPLDELLKYNAMDSYWTMRLYKDQQKEMKEKAAYEFFHKGLLELNKVSQNGIHVDTDFFKEQNDILIRKKRILEKRIKRTVEVKKWDGGKAGDEEFNFNSNAQLSHLLFNILHVKSLKSTAGGGTSVDAEALTKINEKEKLDVLTYTLRWKKLDKLQNTYLDGFLREAINNKINAYFNLHTVRSFRSSANSPNIQNIPVRDKESQQMIRSGIKPRPGNYLLEADYAAIEVRISSCYHKDPAMIKYIKDPTTDMHRDQAAEIFVKAPGDITKEERYLAKNGFVFPQFYGDYFKNNATSIWQGMGEESREHLHTEGIKIYQHFEDHIKDVEYRFWNNKFKVYNQWKIDTWNLYQKQKYLKSHTGFIYSGIMKKNDALNYCIQGSAFHCLLWSLTQLNIWLKEQNLLSLIIGQIHDSIIFDIVPEEADIVLPMIRKVMCDDIRKEWEWIIVPLDIEAKVSEINGNWANLKGMSI